MYTAKKWPRDAAVSGAAVASRRTPPAGELSHRRQRPNAAVTPNFRVLVFLRLECLVGRSEEGVGGQLSRSGDRRDET